MYRSLAPLLEMSENLTVQVQNIAAINKLFHAV